MSLFTKANMSWMKRRTSLPRHSRKVIFDSYPILQCRPRLLHDVDFLIIFVYKFITTATGRQASLLYPFYRASIVAGVLKGEVYVVVDTGNSNKIVGVIVWFGPGTDLYHTYDFTLLGH